MSTVRQEAIRSIACAKHNLNRVDFRKTHAKDLFGVNVFNEGVQRARQLVRDRHVSEPAFAARVVGG